MVSLESLSNAMGALAVDPKQPTPLAATAPVQALVAREALSGF